MDSDPGLLTERACITGGSAPELPPPIRLCPAEPAEFLILLTAMLLQVQLKEVLR